MDDSNWPLRGPSPVAPPVTRPRGRTVLQQGPVLYQRHVASLLVHPRTGTRTGTSKEMV